MDLEELKQKIYKPEQDFNSRLEKFDPFPDSRAAEKAKAQSWQEPEEKKMNPKQKKRLAIGLGVVGVVAVLAIVLSLWYGLNSFDPGKVILTVNGPEKIIAGEEIVYTVEYKNSGRLDLENLKLLFHYPEGALAKEILIEARDLPVLAAGAKSKTEFKVRLVGLREQEKKARAELSYQPRGISSRFGNAAEFVSKIDTVPLALNFDLPQSVVGGQTMDFSLDYLNQAEASFSNLEVRMEYPNGFTVKAAEPSAQDEGKTIWPLGRVLPDEQGKISFSGTIQGEIGEVKVFKARIGSQQSARFIVYGEQVASVRVTEAPLTTSQTVNGSAKYVAKSGDTLNYLITYKNTSAVAIENVIITAGLTGSALNMATLDLKEASLDNGIITWKASNLSVLAKVAPGQESQVGFAIKVKDDLPVASYEDRNFVIKNSVKIDAGKIPIELGALKVSSQNELITRVASKLSLRSRGYYASDAMTNNGPIPPRVGQATAYTIKWSLTNSVNDLSDVRVEAFLPPHVRWLGQVVPSGLSLQYNAATGQLVWQVGELPAATGILLPVKEVAFQIAITPAVVDVGRLVELVGQVRVEATDNFVQQQLISTASALDTDLPDDPQIGPSGGIVVN